MGVNSLPETVTRQRRGCDLNPGRTEPPMRPASINRAYRYNQEINWSNKLQVRDRRSFVAVHFFNFCYIADCACAQSRRPSRTNLGYTLRWFDRRKRSPIRVLAGLDVALLR